MLRGFKNINVYDTQSLLCMLMLSFEYSITLSQHALRPGTISSMKMLILWPIQRILYKYDNAILYGWVIDNVIFVLGLMSDKHAVCIILE